METYTTCYTWMESPVGRLLLAADEGGLIEIAFAEGRTAPVAQPTWTCGGGLLSEPVRQLDAFFAGELRDFDLRLKPRGLEVAVRYSFWRDDFVRRTRAPRRQSRGITRGRPGQRLESHRDCHSVPSRDREQRQAYGLRGWSPEQALANRFRAQPTFLFGQHLMDKLNGH